ncbi:MAG: hypothetical protein AAFR93_02860 [Pseudomonadota bacterium]
MTERPMAQIKSILTNAPRSALAESLCLVALCVAIFGLLALPGIA